jgi:hypothetical protein
MSSRESKTYHAEHRNSGSAAAVARDGLAQIVTKQEQLCGHRVEHTDILIGGVQTQARAERSPVCPLISSSFPRPISSVSQKTERPILDCELSFENTNEALLGRANALTRIHAQNSPFVMPSYLGRGFAPQPDQTRQSVSQSQRDTQAAVDGSR